MALKQNIIYIYFKGKHLVTSKSQYQYNHGQFLYFADLDLPQAFEVHFSNKDKGYSKPKVGSNKLVEIPDEYYWSGAQMIYAWIYLHSDIDDGETVYEVRIPLIKRAEPTDEQPLPQQESAMERAIAELNNAVEITTENANKTGEDKAQVSDIRDEVVDLKENIDATAETVGQKAQDAIDASRRSETSAQNAAEFEEGARNYSEEAKQSAQEALESKNTAKQKADVATDASDEALGYRNEALEAKTQAVQAKQNIVDYRDETKRYRDDTLLAKDEVQNLKRQIDETASEIEETASTVRDDAESANRSASSANESASQASQSANSANESKNQANTYKNDAKEYRDQAEEFKNQSEANVTHYPKIIDDYWYVWDATNEEYINTNVDANGIKGDTGNGIESITLNDDYTLTIVFTDGTSYTTSSIRGEKGDTGESGVYIGTDEPTNENIHVWIDTDDDGTSEDLVADIADLQETNKKILNTYPTKTVSGAIATFDDGVEGLPLKELTIDINPVQDLHGYESPWIGGAGKNLFDQDTAYGAYKQSDGSFLMTGGNGVRFYIPQELVGKELTFSAYLKIPSGSTLTNTRVAVNVGGTASNGNYASTSEYTRSVKTFTPMSTDDYVYITYGSYGSQLLQAKDIQLEIGSTATEYEPYENICPINGWEGMTVNASGYNVWDEEWESGRYTGGDKRANSLMIRSKNYIPVKPNTTYYFNGGVNNGNMWAYLYDENKICLNPAGNGTKVGNLTVLTPDNCYYVNFFLSEQTEYQHDVGINYPSTEHDYHPYIGQTIPISWSSHGTVYGGKLNVLSGKLMVDRAMATFDGSSDENWSYYSITTGNLFRTRLDNRKQGEINSSIPDVESYKCNAYKVAGNSLSRITGTFSGSIMNVDFVNNEYTTLAEWRQYLSENNVQFVYPLAELIEIQLIPHEVNSLLGQNNIFANTGDSTVEYIYDPMKYIDDQINVDDVQINGESIVQDSVANIPLATSDIAGVVKVDPYTQTHYGGVVTVNNKLYVIGSSFNGIKYGGDYSKPIVAGNQHVATFYGLAKASGTDEKDSTLPFGQYTEEAKASIKNMLGVDDVKKDDVYDTYVTDTATGTISSFEDGANNIPLQSLVVDINPVQDLHGYDSPWVGGGGKNLFHNTAVTTTVNGITFTVNSDGSVTANGTATANAVLISPLNELTDGETYILNGCPSGGSSTTHEIMIIPRVGAQPVVNQYGADKSFVYDSKTYKFIQLVVRNGRTVSNLVFYPMIRKSTETDATFAPYENICPISGWTEVDVEQSGKNLFDKNAYTIEEFDVPPQLGLTGKKSGIRINLPLGTYTLRCNAATVESYIYAIKLSANGVYSGQLYYLSASATSGWKTCVIDVAKGEYLLIFKAAAGTFPIDTLDLQIELGSTATSYEPYNGRTIPISWQTEAGTVYGGSLDVLSGVLRVNRKIRTIDAISNVASAYIHSDGVDGYTLDGDIQPRLNPMLQSTQYCNKLKFQAKAIWNSGVSEPNVFAINQNQIHIKIANDLLGITDYTQETTTTAKEKLNAWLAENPVTLTIPIEPIEVQLDAHTINSLYSQNNIFADTGDSAVEYRADTKLYINKKITEAISALT